MSEHESTLRLLQNRKRWNLFKRTPEDVRAGSGNKFIIDAPAESIENLPDLVPPIV